MIHFVEQDVFSDLESFQFSVLDFPLGRCWNELLRKKLRPSYNSPRIVRIKVLSLFSSAGSTTTTFYFNAKGIS